MKPLRRVLALLIVAIAVAAAATGALASFQAGQVFLVRSWVRAERAWDKYLPFRHEALRGLEPTLVRFGVLRPVRIEVEPSVSLLLDPLDDVSRTVLVSRTSVWEPEVWGEISRGLGEGSVYLDIGAHIGHESLKVSKVVGRTGKVIAFEPNPNTLAVLRANIAASGATNIVVQPIALTDTDTELTLYDATLSGNSGASSLAEQTAGPRARAYKVRGRPLDDVVQELGLTRIDLIKADVEGAELIVLRGGVNTLKTFKPKVIVEELPKLLANMGTSIEELEGFLRSVGYTKATQVDYKNKAFTME